MYVCMYVYLRVNYKKEMSRDDQKLHYPTWRVLKFCVRKDCGIKVCELDLENCGIKDCECADFNCNCGIKECETVILTMPKCNN